MDFGDTDPSTSGKSMSGLGSLDNSPETVEPTPGSRSAPTHQNMSSSSNSLMMGSSTNLLSPAPHKLGHFRQSRQIRTNPQRSMERSDLLKRFNDGTPTRWPESVVLVFEASTPVRFEAYRFPAGSCCKEMVRVSCQTKSKNCTYLKFWVEKFPFILEAVSVFNPERRQRCQIIETFNRNKETQRQPRSSDSVPSPPSRNGIHKAELGYSLDPGRPSQLQLSAPRNVSPPNSFPAIQPTEARNQPLDLKPFKFSHKNYVQGQGQAGGRNGIYERDRLYFGKSPSSPQSGSDNSSDNQNSSDMNDYLVNGRQDGGQTTSSSFSGSYERSPSVGIQPSASPLSLAPESSARHTGLSGYSSSAMQSQLLFDPMLPPRSSQAAPNFGHRNRQPYQWSIGASSSGSSNTDEEPQQAPWYNQKRARPEVFYPRTNSPPDMFNLQNTSNGAMPHPESNHSSCAPPPIPAHLQQHYSLPQQLPQHFAPQQLQQHPQHQYQPSPLQGSVRSPPSSNDTPPLVDPVHLRPFHSHHRDRHAAPHAHQKSQRAFYHPYARTNANPPPSTTDKSQQYGMRHGHVHMRRSIDLYEF